MTFDPEPRLARVSAVAREFGIGASTLRRLADEGSVEVVRIGGHRYFIRASVAAFLFDDPSPDKGGVDMPARRAQQPHVRKLAGDSAQRRRRNERFRQRVAERLEGAA